MYISPLKIEFFKVEDGYKQYLLKKPLKLCFERNKSIISYEVPIGFLTDLASIPRPFNKWIKRDNLRYAKSVIIHDYLYTTRTPRNECDKILYMCMKYEVGLKYAIPFWVFVRLGGWIRYYKTKKS